MVAPKSGAGPVADPEADILQLLEPVHAVVPRSFEYGWALLVQGQLGEATHVEEAVRRQLATETEPAVDRQRRLSPTGDDGAHPGRYGAEPGAQRRALHQSRRSRHGQRARQHVAPHFERFLACHQAGRLDETERRFRRGVALLDDRAFFHNLATAPISGTGLRWRWRETPLTGRAARRGAVRRTNIYPFTHVQAIIGLAYCGADGDMALRGAAAAQSVAALPASAACSRNISPSSWLFRRCVPCRHRYPNWSLRCSTTLARFTWTPPSKPSRPPGRPCNDSVGNTDS